MPRILLPPHYSWVWNHFFLEDPTLQSNIYAIYSDQSFPMVVMLYTSEVDLVETVVLGMFHAVQNVCVPWQPETTRYTVQHQKCPSTFNLQAAVFNSFFHPFFLLPLSFGIIFHHLCSITCIKFHIWLLQTKYCFMLHIIICTWSDY